MYVQKRMEQGDPAAISCMAHFFRFGLCGVAQNEHQSFELYLRAAELGFARACFNVAMYYRRGLNGSVPVDVEKYRKYLVLAAKGGHSGARCLLGSDEANHGNMDVAIKHWKISAAMGEKKAMENLKYCFFKQANLSKEEYASAVRAFKTARDEEWSEERDKAAAALKKRR